MKVFVFNRRDCWRNSEAGIYVVAYDHYEAMEMVRVLSNEWESERRQYPDYPSELNLDDALERMAKAQANADPDGRPWTRFVAEVVAVGRAKRYYVDDNASQALQRAFEVAQASEWR